MLKRFLVFDVQKSADAIRALATVVEVPAGDSYLVASPNPDDSAFEYKYSKTVASDAGIRVPLMQVSYPVVSANDEDTPAAMLPALGFVAGSLLMPSLLGSIPIRQGERGWPTECILLVGNEVKKINGSWAVLFGFAIKF
jgi:hypothetical protein